MQIMNQSFQRKHFKVTISFLMTETLIGMMLFNHKEILNWASYKASRISLQLLLIYATHDIVLILSNCHISFRITSLLAGATNLPSLLEHRTQQLTSLKFGILCENLSCSETLT